MKSITSMIREALSKITDNKPKKHLKTGMVIEEYVNVDAGNPPAGPFFSVVVMAEDWDDFKAVSLSPKTKGPLYKKPEYAQAFGLYDVSSNIIDKYTDDLGRSIYHYDAVYDAEIDISEPWETLIQKYKNTDFREMKPIWSRKEEYSVKDHTR